MSDGSGLGTTPVLGPNGHIYGARDQGGAFGVNSFGGGIIYQ